LEPSGRCSVPPADFLPLPEQQAHPAAWAARFGVSLDRSLVRNAVRRALSMSAIPGAVSRTRGATEAQSGHVDGSVHRAIGTSASKGPQFGQSYS
jgi:hypothetical protein